MQNLPRTYTEPLDLARELVKGRKLDALRLIYGSVPDTLSQLIRTAFVAPEGHVLIDADFSAIEARVISCWPRSNGGWKCSAPTAKSMRHPPLKCSASPWSSSRKAARSTPSAKRARWQSWPWATRQHRGPHHHGSLDMGLTEEELPDIVSRWREANKRIRDLWYSMDNAAVQVITEGGSTGVNGLLLAREYDYDNGTDCLTIRLPSGRKLYYISPGIGQNEWGRPSISYMGMDQKTKRWKRIETYGGKLVENCVQAIARDCLALSIERLEAAGLPVVFHVHDEVVIDVAPWDTEDAMLSTVCSIMGSRCLGPGPTPQSRRVGGLLLHKGLTRNDMAEIKPS